MDANAAEASDNLTAAAPDLDQRASLEELAPDNLAGSIDTGQVGAKVWGFASGMEPCQASSSSSVTSLDDPFFQIPLKDSQPEPDPERASLGSSFLERLKLSPFRLADVTSSTAELENPTAKRPADGQDGEMRDSLPKPAAARTLEDFLASPESPNFSPRSFSSFNSSSFSFKGGASTVSTPLESPSLHKDDTMPPNVSPELLHLIDSAIQGSDLNSLKKLQRFVTGEDVVLLAEADNRACRSSGDVVVDVLLAKMGNMMDYEDMKEKLAPRMMLSAGAAVVAGELVPWLSCLGETDIDMSPRTKVVKGLAAVLKTCTRNRAMCSAAGLLRVLLSAARSTFTSKAGSNSDMWNPKDLLHAIEMLGSHCLTVLDLHEWLGTIAETVSTGRSLDLTLSLEKALSGEETRGPSHTFEFDGESSGLLGPGESRWPFNSGYGFATWLYIESFADTVHAAATAAAIAAAAMAKTGKSSAISAAAVASALAGEGTAHMPRLFSFLSADNQGFEAFFHGQFLVVESVSAKKKKASLHFTFRFEPRTWYFVGLEYVYRQTILGKTESEVKLYVDGHLHESQSFEFPRVSKALAFCCIGTNPPPTMAGLQRRRRQCPLFAEMGPVYIFKEPIGEERMSRLTSRGGDYVPYFGFEPGIHCTSINDQAVTLAEEFIALDLEIGPCLHLLYHPKLLVGRLCPDASPSGVSGTHRRPAEVLGHVHIAARVRPTDAIWAMAGGPMSMLPLTVGSFDIDSQLPTLSNPCNSFAESILAAPILRMISVALQHPGNAEELNRGHAPDLLAGLLEHLLSVLSFGESSHRHIKPNVKDEEVVAAVVLLCQAPKNYQSLKVQLYKQLLLNLKLWSCCRYGLQKKLFSSLADMVFMESSTMRAADALQMLLDGCRDCYGIVPVCNANQTLGDRKTERDVGELNALIDELLVIVELLIGCSHGTVLVSDMTSLVQFVLNCPHPSQVARVLHLLYRLIVQPNISRSATFAETFLNCGGAEMMLTLLQREWEIGEGTSYVYSDMAKFNDQAEGGVAFVPESNTRYMESGEILDDTVMCGNSLNSTFKHGYSKNFEPSNSLKDANTDRLEFLEMGRNNAERTSIGRVLGGISLSINADSAKNKFRNIDSGDGVMMGIVGLLGALVIGGHLKLPSSLLAISASPSIVLSTHVAASASGDSVLGSPFFMSIWLLYALQKALHVAPKRLFTDAVYVALLAAVVHSEGGSLTTEDRLNLYDSVHHFEHTQFLLVLLCTLPHASRALQDRALQDILFLACTNSENRKILITMPEWPEWLLEILLTNYEQFSQSAKLSTDAKSDEVEDLVYNFMIIMLEHSMRQKDGWKDVESTIHCVEWLAMVGGASTGVQRQRREELLPIIKRRLLCGLLDFAARELQLLTQLVAAAAAGVAAEGLSPRSAKLEAETASHLSICVAENAVVLLMLVEDHLRSQCQISSLSVSSASASSVPGSPRSFPTSPNFLSLGRTSSDGAEMLESRRVVAASEHSGLSLSVLATMADSNGQISAASMERLTAAVAAEPYDSIRCALASYGSCGVEMAEQWKRRSHLWYGVGLPFRITSFGGGGSGWKIWNCAIDRDENGEWIEFPMVRKSISILQALLMGESGLVVAESGISSGAGAGTWTGSLQQFLDSDQPFFTMLRMVLLAMREEDMGEEDEFSDPCKMSSDHIVHDEVKKIDVQMTRASQVIADKGSLAALLWRILGPLLVMPLSESKRQRVLVIASIIYSEVWHVVGIDRKILRKRYVESIVPPFAALLRKWRPLLSGIHELTDANGQSPLAVEDRSLAADALPSEAALAMITPAWAAAFASPPVSMALAMASAGAGGGDGTVSKSSNLKREFSVNECKTSKLRNFYSFQRLPESSGEVLPVPKDKAASKAAVLAAARDQERTAKIGSGRGLGAVAMASSVQRRSVTDKDRAVRWNLSEALNKIWAECFTQSDTGTSGMERKGIGATQKLSNILSTMVETARQIQNTEVDRQTMLAAQDGRRKLMGIRAWRLLIRNLLEMGTLFVANPFQNSSKSSEHVYWKLDFTENSLRMRKRLKPFYNGTDHHGAAADNEEVTEGAKVASLRDKKQDPSLVIPQAPFPSEHDLIDEITEEAGEVEDGKDEMHRNQIMPSKQPFLHGVPTTIPMNSRVTQSLTTDWNDNLLLEISATMVQPLKVLSGRFQVTTNYIVFRLDAHVAVEGAGREDVEYCSQQRREKIWALSALREVHSRRYLLRRSALELFMVDRSNYFFNFLTAEGRKKAYKALVQASPPFLKNIYAGTQRPEQLLKRSQLTERWANWEISNFEYLMQLNTLAGRSYNDITQYPVFPWILSDYSSKTLNLEDPNVYRDLSKPVGALNSARLEKFWERYENFDDPVIPRFHYGSHYSSAGTVLYYLVRLEPFATLAIQLQGGKFDHADRMFGDISSTWNGVLEDMSDVKELLPELFYMPEVLINGNGIDLGTTQKGNKLGDVNLPTWATSPVDFIQKHRAALESDYTSMHLHEWVDLIFGYKQRGHEAINSSNVFFYMTYEGAIDIDKIDDPVLQKATQDQIAYFGQTPSQLLKIPHPKRKSKLEVLHLQTIFRNPMALQSYKVPFPERCNLPASAICTSHDSVIIVDMNVPSFHVAVHRWQPHTPDGRGLPFHFQHAKAAVNSSGGALMRVFSRQNAVASAEWVYPRAVALPASSVKHRNVIAITEDAHILTGGHADNCLKLIAAENARTLETASGHWAPITCVALSRDGSVLATGSRDCTVSLWRILTNSRISTNYSGSMSDPSLLAAAASSSSSSSGEANTTIYGKKRHIEGPIHVLRGHVNEVTCCCVDTDLDMVVSSSCARGLLMHSIIRGRLIRQLHLQRVDALALSSEGTIIVWDELHRDIQTFTINGISIAKRHLPFSEGDITSISVSVDGQHAVIGTSCGNKQNSDTNWHGSSSFISESLQSDSNQTRDLTKCSDCNLANYSEQSNIESGKSSGETMSEWIHDSKEESKTTDQLPSVILIDLHSLKVLWNFKLQKGQDVTAISLQEDSTTLILSTADGQLLVYTDPALSIKVVDHMLRLGWEGDGLTSYIS